MREIKFRAWDKGSKSWVNLADGTLAGMCCEEYGANPYFTNNVIYMQYTGLKDKNGKEIYEGDIVKFEECHTGKEWITKVIYSEGLAMFVFREDDSHLDMSDIVWDKYIEVIGNIYENPELVDES